MSAKIICNKCNYLYDLIDDYRSNYPINKHPERDGICDICLNSFKDFKCINCTENEIKIKELEDIAKHWKDRLIHLYATREIK